MKLFCIAFFFVHSNLEGYDEDRDGDDAETRKKRQEKKEAVQSQIRVLFGQQENATKNIIRLRKVYKVPHFSYFYQHFVFVYLKVGQVISFWLLMSLILSIICLLKKYRQTNMFFISKRIFTNLFLCKLFVYHAQPLRQLSGLSIAQTITIAPSASAI